MTKEEEQVLDLLDEIVGLGKKIGEQNGKIARLTDENAYLRGVVDRLTGAPSIGALPATGQEVADVKG